MRSATDRNQRARSNYEQLRLSVTRGIDGRRFAVLWWKDKHQGWQYSHIVRRGEYSALAAGGSRRQALTAAIDLLEEELFALDEGEIR